MLLADPSLEQSVVKSVLPSQAQNLPLQVAVLAHVQPVLLRHHLAVLDQPLVEEVDLSVLGDHSHRVLSGKDALGLHLDGEGTRVECVEHAVEEDAIAFGPEDEGVGGDLEVDDPLVLVEGVVVLGELGEGVVAHDQIVHPGPEDSPVVDAPAVDTAVVQQHHDEVVHSRDLLDLRVALLANLSNLLAHLRLVQVDVVVVPAEKLVKAGSPGVHLTVLSQGKGSAVASRNAHHLLAPEVLLRDANWSVSSCSEGPLAAPGKDSALSGQSQGVQIATGEGLDGGVAIELELVGCFALDGPTVFKSAGVGGVVGSDEAEMGLASGHADDVLGGFDFAWVPDVLRGGASPAIGGGSPGEQLGREEAPAQHSSQHDDQLIQHINSTESQGIQISPIHCHQLGNSPRRPSPASNSSGILQCFLRLMQVFWSLSSSKNGCLRA